MANNVYVGSRYVPLFDGAWSNTKSYEPLTIVTYTNGNSYTSKKPVPAGTLPTNTTYWALSGNFNGQISNLQTQINTINSAITGINTTLGKLYTVTNSTILTVAKVGGMYTTINAAITAAKALSNQAIIFVGPGTYSEHFDLKGNSKVSIIGSGIDNTIIQNDNASFDTMELTGRGYFANFTIKEQNNNAKYALHIEAQNNNTAGTIVFENVRFMGHSHAGAGMGLGANFNVNFYQCIFETDTSTYPAMYLHNFPNPTANINMYATFIGCKFINNSGSKPIVIENARGIYYPSNTYKSNMYLDFEHCEAYNPKITYNHASGTHYGYITGTEVALRECSAGNNIWGLNYDHHQFIIRQVKANANRQVFIDIPRFMYLYYNFTISAVTDENFGNNYTSTASLNVDGNGYLTISNSNTTVANLNLCVQINAEPKE